ncbi:MAG: hypothetical protein AAFR75_02225 [Pseudomonadota bacterium]
MIFVQRTATPDRLDLGNPESAAAKELRSATEIIVESGERPPVSHFKAYSHETVREALKEMFHGKCAYCESKIAGSSQTDIEHYRPKGSVSEFSDHPGYWWLAMVWDNLVLSCMHCNQSRRQLSLDPNMTEEEIKEAIIANDLQTTGKLNQFPTRDSIWVTEPDGDLSIEQPLLIDPTLRDPETLFEWSGIDQFALVSANGGDDCAEATIAALGLNRRWLCEQRMARWIRLSAMFEDVRTAIDSMIEASTEEVASAHLEAAERDIDKLLREADDRTEHAAMARSFLAQSREILEEALGA